MHAICLNLPKYDISPASFAYSFSRIGPLVWKQFGGPSNTARQQGYIFGFLTKLCLCPFNAPRSRIFRLLCHSLASGFIVARLVVDATRAVYASLVSLTVENLSLTFKTQMSFPCAHSSFRLSQTSLELASPTFKHTVPPKTTS